MTGFSIKRTIVRGIALAVPLGIVLYVFIKFIGIFEKMVAPLARKFHIESIFGEITITIIAVLILLILTFFLGLLMHLPFVRKAKDYAEEWILKLFPSLNHLKLMAAEKLDAENASHNWKPVLLQKGNELLPAYLIEETNEWLSFVIAKPPSTEPRDSLIIKKNAVSYIDITMKEMSKYNKQFGKGYTSMVADLNKVN